MQRLFVYGTLAPGRVNYGVMRDIPGKWETATMKGTLLEEGWGSVMGCPGVIPSPDGSDVDGFLFSSPQLAEHASYVLLVERTIQLRSERFLDEVERRLGDEFLVFVQYEIDVRVPRRLSGRVERDG